MNLFLYRKRVVTLEESCALSKLQHLFPKLPLEPQRMIQLPAAQARVTKASLSSRYDKVSGFYTNSKAKFAGKMSLALLHTSQESRPVAVKVYAKFHLYLHNVPSDQWRVLDMNRALNTLYSPSSCSSSLSIPA